MDGKALVIQESLHQLDMSESKLVKFKQQPLGTAPAISRQDSQERNQASTSKHN